MALLHELFPGLALEHLPLGSTPTPVRRLDEAGAAKRPVIRQPL